MPRIADFTSPAAQLTDSFDQLIGQWRSLEGLWNDRQSERVEKEFLESIGPKLQMTLDAIQRVDSFLLKAQRVCGSYEQ